MCWINIALSWRTTAWPGVLPAALAVNRATLGRREYSMAFVELASISVEESMHDPDGLRSRSKGQNAGSPWPQDVKVNSFIALEWRYPCLASH